MIDRADTGHIAHASHTYRHRSVLPRSNGINKNTLTAANGAKQHGLATVNTEFTIA